MENKFNFTKKTIDALSTPDPGKRDTYHDIKTAGLQLRITSTGVKSFSIYKRISGSSPERITLGRYPDMTIEKARLEAARIAGDIASGKNPAAIKRGTREELTFAELFGDYMEQYSRHNKKTWREDESQYRLYLEKPLGKKKLSAIDRSSIKNIHLSITRAGHPITANRVKSLISGIFGWAILEGLWETNPASGIRRNKEKSRERFIQGEELPRFFQALADEPNQTIRDYVLMSLLTGARRSNVQAMRWQDISFDRHEWRIDETKNGTPQTVTLSPEAVEILQNRRPSNDAVFVFPGRGELSHLMNPARGWQRILERAGINNLRIHDLRRTLGSWQCKTGASLAIIGKSLNHKNQNTTAIYARLDLDPVRDSVNKATSAMMQAAGLKDSADVMKIGKNT
ncbi:tyrosine-type recombinase/integrase [Nitrosomonas sp.]|uniref:tyrosine-type recombinase/integrase n=1 Tax=Nitrosomonas sp. TaxID=42353 RepID=UPI00374D02ED